MTSPPLSTLRVVDITIGPLGSIGRILAELGADVVRIEPRGGAIDRHQGPMIAGVSLAFAAANVGKRGAALNLGEDEDRAQFEALLAGADILLENTSPGSQAACLLDIARLRRICPTLTVLSISDFGAGDFAHWQASDAVLQALCGELARSGLSGRAPLLPPGELALQCSAAQGAYVVLIAYINRLITGGGDHLDFSLLDATTQALDPGYGIAGSATAGTLASQAPRGRANVGHQYPIIACKDGFVRLCVLSARQWQGLFTWMGKPEAFADPSFKSVRTRFASPALVPHIAGFFADKTRAEIEAQAQAFHVPAAAVHSLAEALASEHIRVRTALTQIELSPGVHVTLPNGVMEIDGVRATPSGSLPKLDQSAKDVVSAWAGPRSGSAPVAFGLPGRPLAGLRVLDLGVIVVGAEQGRLLADFGADVIKVESAAFPDGMRASTPLGVSALFASGHRNKRSLGINLRDPEGRRLFLELVAQSDVVLSNFKPGTLESLGLGPKVLLAANPQLVISESSAFGSTGPWSGRMGYGPLVRASAGLTAHWRYPDAEDSFSDTMTVYPDHVAARVGVIGVLALLIRRLAQNRGGVVSQSQAEVMLSHQGAEIAELCLTQAGRKLEGGPVRDAPYGVYPSLGDDDWCVVCVRDSNDWRALCDVMDRADLKSDPALATAVGRAAQRGRLDCAVSDWLATRAAHEAMVILQDGGVPAAKMLRVSELPDFPYYQARGLFGCLVQPQVDFPITVDLAPVHTEHLAKPPLTPAPAFGEHTRQIAHDQLGLSPERIDALIAAKVLEVG